MMYQDICWLCLGTIGLAECYLKEDNSLQMAQDKHGSNVNKNHFANIKNKNSNPTKVDADNSCAKSTTICSNMFTINYKANTSGQ
eukprot:15349800-Ditylum_brightwellii.AAC.1